MQRSKEGGHDDKEDTADAYSGRAAYVVVTMTSVDY